MKRRLHFRIILLSFVLLVSLALIFWWSIRSAAPARTAVAAPAVPTTQATAAELPRVTTVPPAPALTIPRRDAWASAQTVASVEERAADGRSISRVRVVKTDFKYPLLRLEETWAIDPSDGRESLLKQSSMVADHVMVKPRPGLGEREFTAFTAQHGLSIRSRLPASGIFLVSLPDASVLKAMPDAISLLRQENSPAALVEPDYLVRIAATPNDQRYSQLWGMHNTGQNGGIPDADIDAPEAWDTSTGSADVLVGIIDTGVSYTHPDLVNNMWTNPAEIADNLIDDDGNGYVDDVRGWDFYGNDKNPDDPHGHGTHCAGTIGAEGNNGIGVAGVCWNVSMVALRFLNAEGQGTSSDGTEAIAYATSLGVDLTSNSWGGEEYSSFMYEAVQNAGYQGILFIAAAGNSSRTNDVYPNYPSNFFLENVISVASTTTSDVLSSFSNLGPNSVHLAAPGSNILSTYKGNAYQAMSGTSMATPHVAGASALLKGYRPDLTAEQIKAILLSSVDLPTALSGKVITGGRLNINNALASAQGFVLAPFTVFKPSGSTGGPFAPAHETYNLRNLRSTPLTWSSSSSAAWLQASPAGGTLAPGEQISVQLTLTPAAAALVAGSYQAQMQFLSGAQVLSTRTAQFTVHPPPILTFNLDTNPGWSTQDQWQFGVPQGLGGSTWGAPDPTSGATGSNVYGINLAGNYATTVAPATYLTTTAMDLSLYDSTKLRFRRWLNSDTYSYVSQKVEVSLDGTNWAPLWYNSFTTPAYESQWSTQVLNLPSYVDRKPTVYIRWSHHVHATGAYPYAGWNLDDIEILGTLRQHLTFTLSPELTEGTTTSGSIIIFPAATTDTPITLAATGVGVPPTVTIAQGTDTVNFTITAADDALLNGSRTASLTAATPGYDTIQGTLQVHDNETATLSLSAPATLREGGDAGQATVHVSAPVGEDTRVQLTASPAGQLSFPAEVTIPSGASQATFSLAAENDTILDGTVLTTLSAQVQNWTSGSAQVSVEDNEATSLVVTLPASGYENGGTLAGASVRVAGTVSSPLIVSLASSDTTELQVPATVTIPQGSSSENFSLTLPNDNEVDGAQTVTVSATAAGLEAGSVSMVIRDDDPTAYTFAPIVSPKLAGTPFSITVTALDENGDKLTAFRGPVTLSAANAEGVMPCTPVTTPNFTNGAWTGNLTIQRPGLQAVVTASDSRGRTGSSNFFDLNTTPVLQVTLANNWLSYSNSMKRLFVTTPTGNLISIDPETAVQSPAIYLGTANAARQIEIAPGEVHMFVAVDDGRKVRRLTLPDLTPEPAFGLGVDTSGNANRVVDMVALPETLDSVAVSVSPSDNYAVSTSLYDAGVKRPVSFTQRITALEPGAVPGRLYGFDSSTTGNPLRRLDYTASGLTQLDTFSIAMGTGLKFANGLLYGAFGKVVDAEKKLILKTTASGGIVCPDPERNRIYYLISNGTIVSYDLSTSDQIGTFTTGINATSASNLVRWGERGLAFRTPSQVILVLCDLVPDRQAADLAVTQLASPLVAPANGIVTFTSRVVNLGLGIARNVSLTYTVTGHQGVQSLLVDGMAPTSGTANPVILGDLQPGEERIVCFQVLANTSGSVRNIVTVSAAEDTITSNNTANTNSTIQNLTASQPRKFPLDDVRDTAYDRKRGCLYVSSGNMVYVVDPVDYSIDDIVNLGALTVKLALSADFSRLYVGLDSLSAACVVDLATLQVEAPFTLGASSSSGGTLPTVGAMVVSPLDPELLAVSLNEGTGYPKFIALFKNGVQLGARISARTVDLVFDKNNLLIGLEQYTAGSYYKVTVTPTGPVLGQTWSTSGTTVSDPGLRSGHGRIYSYNGAVVDPGDEWIVGTNPVIGYTDPDPLLPYVYVGTRDNPETLNRIDATTLQVQFTDPLHLDIDFVSEVNRMGRNGLTIRQGNFDSELHFIKNPTLVISSSVELVLPSPVLEGSGLLATQGIARLAERADTPSVVQLTNNRPDLVVVVPASVTIPPGSVEATFPITVLNNTLLDGAKSVSITTSGVTAYSDGTFQMEVRDDETATLTLSLTANVTEGTDLPIGGTLTLSQPAEADITVNLVSSLLKRLRVPATATIPQGSTQVDFALNPVNTDYLDGTQSVQVTATIPGWTSASASTNVVDDDPLTLSLSLADSGPENTFVSGTINLTAKATSNVVVTVSNPNSSQFTTPSTLTIFAGTSSTNISVGCANDVLLDGDFTGQITLSAPGFTGVAKSFTVLDRTPASLVWEEMPTSFVAGVPSTVGVRALAITGAQCDTISIINLNLEQKSGSESIPLLTPLQTLSNGYGALPVTLARAGQGMRLRATSTAYPWLDSLSPEFTVLGGTANRFTFSAIEPEQLVNLPFAATVTAYDAWGNQAETYSGSPNITQLTNAVEATVGTGVTTDNFLLDVSRSRSRTQMIFTAAEIGQIGNLRGLAFYINLLPTVPTTLKLRLRPTPLTDYPATALWEAPGAPWVEVHSGTFSPTQLGWNTIWFTIPFNYDGTTSLMVDASLESATTGGRGIVSCCAISNRVINYSTSSSSYGAPTAWSGSSPTPTRKTLRPNMRFTFWSGITFPGVSTIGPFSQGVWTGPFRAYTAGSNLSLRLVDGGVGISDAFNAQALAAPVLAAEPTHTGGTENSLAWPEVSLAGEYLVQSAPTASFATPLSSPWVTTPEHTFTDLIHGTLQYYRARSRKGVTLPNGAGGQSTFEVFSGWSNIVSTNMDSTAPALTVTTPDAGFSSTMQPSLPLAGTVSDTGSGLAEVSVNTTSVFPTGAAWSLNYPLSPGANSLIIQARDKSVPPNITTLELPFTRLLDADGNLLPDDWQDLAGLPPGTDRLLDPDFDGVATWLEYYLGADPITFRATDLPTMKVRINPADNKRYLEYQYSRRIGSMEVEEFVELSEALGAWAEHPERLEVVTAPVPNADGVTETVCLRLLPSLDNPGAEPRAYLRLGIRLRQ